MTPNAIAEQAIIGALLTDQGSIDRIENYLEPEMFQSPLLGLFYKTIKEAHDRQEPVDIATLVEIASEKGFSSDNTTHLVHDCMRSNIGSMNIGADASLVAKSYMQRQYNLLLNRAIRYNEKNYDGVTVEEQISTVQEDLESLTKNTKPVSKSLAEIAAEYENEYFVPREMGISIGFASIDDLLGGLEGGDFTVIAARPSVGKSALAAQIASNIAKTGKVVQYFNLEMKEKQMYERFLSTISGVSMKRIRNAIGFKNDEEREQIRKANEILKRNDRLHITTGGKTVSKIFMECKKVKPDVVIIDYLQLITPESRYSGNRYAEVGAISHAIKNIAMTLNIPVIVLSQLNRESAQRPGMGIREPGMSDIRESGDIEQDASQIILLWNSSEDDKNQKTVKVDKNRQGVLGRVNLFFDGETMKFVEEGAEPEADGWSTIGDDSPFPILLEE